jgi:hypothetical protein
MRNRNFSGQNLTTFYGFIDFFGKKTFAIFRVYRRAEIKRFVSEESRVMSELDQRTRIPRNFTRNQKTPIKRENQDFQGFPQFSWFFSNS